MKSTLFKNLLVLTFFIIPIFALADDTDLFVGVTPTTADLPNVLIILDNTANWNNSFTNEMAAVSSVISNLPANKFRVGFALFTENGSGNSGPDGGYIRAAIRTLDATNKSKYSALVSSIDKLNDKSNNGKTGLAMAEAYRYFSGGSVYAGNNKSKTDYTGNISGTASDNAVHTLPANALSTISGSTYISPVLSGSCAKNFIIYVSNGPAQENITNTSIATNMLSTDAASAGIGS